MIIERGSDLILTLTPLKGDNGDNIRVESKPSFYIKVFTADKKKYLEYTKEDITTTNRLDKLYISADELAMLESGVIAYTYGWGVTDSGFEDDGEYNRNNTVYTNYYFKNECQISETDPALVQQVEELEDKVSDLTTIVDNDNKKLADLQTKHSKDIISLNSNLSGKITNNSNRIQTIEDTYVTKQALESNLKSEKNYIDGADTLIRIDVNGVKQDVETLQQNVSQNINNIEQHDQRITYLENITISPDFPTATSPLHILATSDKLQAIIAGDNVMWAAEDAPVVRICPTSTRSGEIMFDNRQYEIKKARFQLTDGKLVHIKGESTLLLPQTFATVSDNQNTLYYIKISGILLDSPLNGDNSFRLNKLWGAVSVDLSDLDMKQLTEISWRFEVCEKLESLKLPADILNRYTDLSGLFYGCEKLMNLKLNCKYTSKITKIDQMFFKIGKVPTDDICNWTMTNLESCEQTFAYINDTKLDLSKWECNNLTNWRLCFRNCPNLEYLDIRGWNPENISAIGGNNADYYYGSLIYQCPKLHTLYVPQLGKCRDATLFDVSSTIWGTAGEESRTSLINSLITNAFDRATAGYPVLTIKLSAATKAILTEEEQAQIIALGYAIS